jgi:FKBP-type peptidyl-prolyl cis-trans isomerase
MQTFTRLTGVIIFSSGLLACSQQSSDNTPLETLQQKASYSYGVDVAVRLKQQGVELDASALNRGIADAYNGKELAMSDEERLQAKSSFQEELRNSLVKKQETLKTENLAAGKAFLEANANKEGVITTESGLQYKILSTGDGKQPTESDTVTTHYRGTLIDGREFDSSYKRDKPATFPVKGVIQGWTEALQLMHVGDKWQLFIPSELAYGESQRSELIQPNSTLIFEIELLGIEESDS